MIIYHNPRCGTSRKALKLIKESGIEPDIRLYMSQPLSHDELKEVLNKLGIKPFELVRTKEAIYKEKYKGKSLSDDEWIAAMIEHPKLMQRPIVVNENKAELGRPVENIIRLL